MPSHLARRLRQNPTDAEARLWSHLCRKQIGCYRFRRKVPLGKYVVDFACLNARLVVEVDGGQHEAAVDQERTAWLESEGFRVVRFWNTDVLQNTEGVIDSIGLALRAAPPPQPSPARGEGEG